MSTVMRQRGGCYSFQQWSCLCFLVHFCIFQFIFHICIHFPLQSPLPSQTSANISITRSGCSTYLSTVLQTEGKEKGNLRLHLTCHPHLSVKASVQHSVDAIQTLGFPTHGAIILNVSSAHLPGVEAGLELGRCYFRGNLGKTKAAPTEEEQSSYAVNVTHYCPALQVRNLLALCSIACKT